MIDELRGKYYIYDGVIAGEDSEDEVKIGGEADEEDGGGSEEGRGVEGGGAGAARTGDNEGGGAGAESQVSARRRSLARRPQVLRLHSYSSPAAPRPSPHLIWGCLVAAKSEFGEKRLMEEEGG